MSRRSAGGSILVEASMVVPIFFIALVPFLYLMRISLTQAILERAMDEALRSLAVESYVLLRENGSEDPPEASEDLSDEIPDAGELQEIREEMKDAAREGGSEEESLLLDLFGTVYLRRKVLENLSGLDLQAMGIEGGEAGLSFLGSRFFFSEGTHRHLLNAQMTVAWASPFSFFDPPDSVFSRTVHAFSGEKGPVEVSEGAGEPSDSDDTYVYRIGQGVHYHQESCFLIDKDILMISVAEAEQMGLFPCSRCESSLVVTGEVYMTSGGDHYHRSSCGYLFPDLQEMTLEEAVRLGLTPCGLCYGSEGYFQ